MTSDIHKHLTAASVAMRDAGMDLPSAAALFLYAAWELVAQNLDEADADRWLREMGNRKFAAGVEKAKHCTVN